MIIILIGVSVFCFVFILTLQLMNIQSGKEEKRYQKVISRKSYSLEKKNALDESLENIVLEKPKISEVQLINQLLSKITLFKTLAANVRKVGFGFNVFALMLASFVMAVCCYYLFIYLKIAQPIALVISVGIALFPYTAVYIKLSARRKKFSKYFIEALSIIRNTLQSGQGLTSAMKIVTQDAPYPVNEEFQALLTEIDYGFSFEEAIDRMKERMPTEEFTFFASAIKIQRQSGGNLSQIIENIEDSIRSRAELKRELNALSAQGKLSGLILVMMPVVIFVGLRIFNPVYFDPLFNDPMGKKMFISAVVAGVIGAAWIYKIVNIKL